MAIAIPVLLMVFSAPQTADENGGEPEGCISREEFRSLKRDLLYMMGDFDIFSDQETENIVLTWQLKEWRAYGTESMWKRYMTKKYKNSVVMQRSGRHRLYDHNIFLANLFEGNIVHKQDGNLGKKFHGALFLDIGSAILMDEGAPTVRDIYEDRRILPHLSNILATDINGKGCEYISAYRKKPNLPFPVREVDMRLIKVSQLYRLTHGLIKEDTPVIMRSANSGPDLYYRGLDLKEHMRMIIRAFYDRPVLYFFNKFILYKSKNSTWFQILGRDSGIGSSHRTDSWEDGDWDNRKLHH
jgi:hypothetical protein